MLEINLGFVGNLKMRKMIVGEISALTADLPTSGPATVEVQGFDLFHGLTRGTVYRKFGGEEPQQRTASDSEIVSHHRIGNATSSPRSRKRLRARRPESRITRRISLSCKSWRKPMGISCGWILAHFISEANPRGTRILSGSNGERLS